MTTHKLPPQTSDGLRELWLRARGASEAAAVAQQVAKSLYEAYQARFNTALEMLECDPNTKWWIDFRTGEVHEGDPPSEGVKGDGGESLSIRPEANSVQTNGRTA